MEHNTLDNDGMLALQDAFEHLTFDNDYVFATNKTVEEKEQLNDFSKIILELSKKDRFDLGDVYTEKLYKFEEAMLNSQRADTLTIADKVLGSLVKFMHHTDTPNELRVETAKIIAHVIMSAHKVFTVENFENEFIQNAIQNNPNIQINDHDKMQLSIRNDILTYKDNVYSINDIKALIAMIQFVNNNDVMEEFHNPHTMEIVGYIIDSVLEAIKLNKEELYNYDKSSKDRKMITKTEADSLFNGEVIHNIVDALHNQDIDQGGMSSISLFLSRLVQHSLQDELDRSKAKSVWHIDISKDSLIEVTTLLSKTDANVALNISALLVWWLELHDKSTTTGEYERVTTEMIDSLCKIMSGEQSNQYLREAHNATVMINCSTAITYADFSNQEVNKKIASAICQLLDGRESNPVTLIKTTYALSEMLKVGELEVKDSVLEKLSAFLADANNSNELVLVKRNISYVLYQLQSRNLSNVVMKNIQQALVQCTIIDPVTVNHLNSVFNFQLINHNNVRNNNDSDGEEDSVELFS